MLSWGGKKRTKLLIVSAPMALTSLVPSSTRKTTTRRDGILSFFGLPIVVQSLMCLRCCCIYLATVACLEGSMCAGDVIAPADYLVVACGLFPPHQEPPFSSHRDLP